MYANDDDVTYFDSFRAEHIRKEIKDFKGKKNITKNIYRIGTYNSEMRRYFCIEFIENLLDS